LLGVLLGWGAIAASDTPPTADGLGGLSGQARLVTGLDGSEGLAALREARSDSGAGSGAVPASAQPARAEPGLGGPDTPQAAPASRLAVAGQSNTGFSSGSVVTAPLGSGNPVPAFAAVAGAILQHPPSALAASASRPSTGKPAVDRTQVMKTLGHTGLSFEPNVGQTASRVDFLARTGSGTVFLTPTAAVFAMQKAPSGPPSVDPNNVAGMPSPNPATPRSNGGVALYMDLVGANPSARPVGREELPGKMNYFLGNDPTQWHSNVPTFGRVTSTLESRWPTTAARAGWSTTLSSSPERMRAPSR
jgi:hypothetical protein